MSGSFGKLSCKAKRRGDRFCSPACGRRSWREYQSAIAHGKQLASELGSGWKHSVWENLGWNYDAVHQNGMIRVTVGSTNYTAWLTINGEQIAIRDAKNPLVAVQKALRTAYKYLDSLDSAMRIIQKDFKLKL